MSLAAFSHADVEQFTREFEAQFDAGDAAGMAACYAADAKLLAEDTEPVRGRAAIAEFWQAAIGQAQAAGARRTISLDEVTSSGDLGYALGTVTLQLPAAGGGHPPLPAVIKYATIWQRAAGGRWWLIVDISNRNPAGRLR